MGIFYTPNEANDNSNSPQVKAGTTKQMKTRLDEAVLKAGTPVKNLELYTGADLLVSTLSLPLRDLDGTEPRLKLLAKHVEAGVLIQRKSGRDFTSSIPILAEILERMLSTEYIQVKRRLCELVICADIHAARDGECIIDGQGTGFTYNAYLGAKSWWELRGGYVTVLSRDNLLAGHINGWLERLRQVEQHPEYQIVRRVPQQMLQAPDWRDTLATLPGIGYKKATQIANHCGSLATSLVWCSELDSSLEGIGKGTKENLHNYMGLDERTRIELTTVSEDE